MLAAEVGIASVGALVADEFRSFTIDDGGSAACLTVTGGHEGADGDGCGVGTAGRGWRCLGLCQGHVCGCRDGDKAEGGKDRERASMRHVQSSFCLA